MNQYFTVRNDRFATKHVFAGSQRVVTKLVRPWEGPGKGLGNGGTPPGQNESRDQYFYHPDHLGSTNYVTDSQGRLYEHTEYFPFGEPWVEEHSKSTQITPYLFTGKEYDRETGLYYFGARYYDPRTSLWASVDPALGDYLSIEQSGTPAYLDGLGGAYRSVNLSLYQYAAWQPFKYIDSSGEDIYFIYHAPKSTFDTGHMGVAVDVPENGKVITADYGMWLWIVGGDQSPEAIAKAVFSLSRGVVNTRTRTKAEMKALAGDESKGEGAIIRFKTSEEVDRKAEAWLRAAIKKSGKQKGDYFEAEEEYNMLLNSCTDFCQDFLSGITEGKFSGEGQTPSQYKEHLMEMRQEIQAYFDSKAAVKEAEE